MNASINVLEIRPDGRTRWEMPEYIWRMVEHYGIRHEHPNIQSIVDRLPKVYRYYVTRTEFPYPIPAPEPEMSFDWINES